MTTVTKPRHLLTLSDRLSRLSFEEACKLLGPQGRKMIYQGSRYEVDLDEQVYFGGDLFRLTLPHGLNGDTATVTLTLRAPRWISLPNPSLACCW